MVCRVFRFRYYSPKLLEIYIILDNVIRDIVDRCRCGLLLSRALQYACNVCNVCSCLFIRKPETRERVQYLSYTYYTRTPDPSAVGPVVIPDPISDSRFPVAAARTPDAGYEIEVEPCK